MLVLLNFIDGVKGARKGYFMRHIKVGALHDLAQTALSKTQTNSESGHNEPLTSSPTGNHIREKYQQAIEESAYLNPVVSELPSAVCYCFVCCLKRRICSGF